MRARAGDASGASGHIVHASLYRPVLFVGVEFGVIVAEATTVLALLFVLGVHLGTVVLAVVYALGVHATAAWVTARDPQITDVYLRGLFRRAYYPPISDHVGIARRPEPAMASQ